MMMRFTFLSAQFTCARRECAAIQDSPHSADAVRAAQVAELVVRHPCPIGTDIIAHLHVTQSPSYKFRTISIKWKI